MHAARQRFNGLPAAVRGALLMTGSACAFAVMAILIRLASDRIHAFEIAFFRNLFGLMFMLPWIARGTGLSRLATPRFGLYMLRAVFGIAAMLSFFWALTAMPLAGAVALSFTAPLFITIGAAVILRETVGARRWSATLVGLAGTLIILRPGAASVQPAALAALFSAVAMAGSALSIKVLTRTEPTDAIVTWMVVLMTPLSLPAALWVWETPDWQTWLWLVLIGAFGTIGHMMLTRAMKVADASYVMPFDFTRLPAVALMAWLLFGETVDAFTWAGALVIFGATVYIVQREARLQVLDEAERAALAERAR
jgi:drug/metabolite transporter (DMT)-like permease